MYRSNMIVLLDVVMIWPVTIFGFTAPMNLITRHRRLGLYHQNFMTVYAVFVWRHKSLESPAL